MTKPHVISKSPPQPTLVQASEEAQLAIKESVDTLESAALVLEIATIKATAPTTNRAA
jgi:hypothetical protein